MSQTHTVGSHKTTIATDHDNITRVTYHSTVVVLFTPKQITLDTGGYQSNTTKTRMNQASNQFNLGYRVFQKDWDWFVDFKGETLPFDDRTLTLAR